MADHVSPPGRQPTRRSFCAHACQSASLMALGTLAQRCGGDGGSPAGPSGMGAAPTLPVVNASVLNGAVAVDLDGTPLAAVNGAALVRSPVGDFLVAHTGQDTFTALTAVCTHEACTITGFRDQAFVCPCHGSQFNTGGGVINGPATRSLAQFATELAGGTLAIRI